MSNYAEFMPRNKHDFDRVKKIKRLARNEQLLMLPALLEWIQDMNWPIAMEVAELLLLFPDEIVPLIKGVLETNDNVWKYWCLEILVKRLPDKLKMQFKADLIRLVKRPTAAEKLELLDEIANEILQMNR